MMSALSVLIILINLFNISHAFGCCGGKPKPHWTPRAIKAPTVQDIVNTYCRAGANICNLRSKGITHLEYVNFPPEVTLLYLSHNHIVSLKNSKFPANLVELYLDFNKLYFDTSSSSVNIFNIRHLTSLSVLSLDYNKILGLENVYLPHNLTILSLRGNAIRSLSNLRSLSSLQVLNLNKNGIRSMSTNIGEKLPPSLETLLLRENEITNIDTEIPNALTTLDLRDNPLTEYHIRNWNGRCRVLTENTPLESNSIIDHIDRLPTLVWNEKMVIQANCQICCEDFANGDTVRILPCLHKFHCDCVQSWLVDKQICPGCRHNINEVE